MLDSENEIDRKDVMQAYANNTLKQSKVLAGDIYIHNATRLSVELAASGGDFVVLRVLDGQLVPNDFKLIWDMPEFEENFTFFGRPES